MRKTVDISSLFRSSIGFDHFIDTLENASREPFDEWPACDIVKTGEDEYAITLAVPGYSSDALTIVHEPNMLTVTGEKLHEDRPYLHRGMDDRPFRKRFDLADHVTASEAELANGLLTISLKRELPEEMKPRRIAISGGPASPMANANKAKSRKQAA